MGVFYLRDHFQKKLKNWAVEYTNKPPLVGLQAILEAYGSEGWELVSLLPERSRHMLGLGRGTSSQRLSGRRQAPAQE